MIFDRTLTANCGELVRLHPDAVANNVRGKADSLATQLAKELSAKGVPDEFPTSPADAEKRAAYCYDVTVRFYLKDETPKAAKLKGTTRKNTPPIESAEPIEPIAQVDVDELEPEA